MALERYRGDVKLLTAAEQYMLAMATLPHAPLLLEILLFKHQFREHITELDRQVRERDACCAIAQRLQEPQVRRTEAPESQPPDSAACVGATLGAPCSGSQAVCEEDKTDGGGLHIWKRSGCAGGSETSARQG